MRRDHEAQTEEAIRVLQKETKDAQIENMEKENEVNIVSENEWQTVSPGKVGRSAGKKGKRSNMIPFSQTLVFGAKFGRRGWRNN